VQEKMSQTDIITLSVIFPAYNAGAYLKPAIMSLLNQSFRDFEILVLDDGSTDGSIDSLCTVNDRRISIISDGKNRGIAFRLNEGIRLSRGRYIARMDADDLSFPDRFEKQLSYLEKHPTVDILSTRAVVFNNQGDLIRLLPFKSHHTSICAHPWLTIPMPHPTWMVRREWYMKYLYRLPELERAEDQELLLRSMNDSQFACLPDILLAYRQGQFNFFKTFLARRNLLKAQLNLFLKDGYIKFAILSLIAFFLKCLIDVFASLPGYNSLFLNKTGGSLPHDIEEITIDLIRQKVD
jgi:glycosyltransferase involved in cell wall biosynthesis